MWHASDPLGNVRTRDDLKMYMSAPETIYMICVLWVIPVPETIYMSCVLWARRVGKTNFHTAKLQGISN